MQCNFLTDILDLVYLRFALNVQRVHLSTEKPAASRMLEPFGELAEMFLNTFHHEQFFLKLKIKKLLRKNRSKNLIAGVFFSHLSFEPRHQVSNNVVCATSIVSDQPAHTRSLIRAIASRLNIA